MDRILFVNACIRPESRTLRLANCLLDTLEGHITEVNLEKEGIMPLNTESLRYRQKILAEGKFDDPMLRYARGFKEADIIVIAAPYYDLSFPSSLKVYLETVCCVGLTFYYDENEVAQTLCRCRKLYYVSTGGGVLKKQFGYEYVKALVKEFFHVSDVYGFFAESLDLQNSDSFSIMDIAEKTIKEKMLPSCGNLPSNMDDSD